MILEKLCFILVPRTHHPFGLRQLLGRYGQLHCTHIHHIVYQHYSVPAQAAQAHASRKRGIYKLFMVLEPGRERPVLGYKRPLTIWDFVWGIKYRRFRTWNKTQFQHFLVKWIKLTYLLRLCVFFGLISSFWAFFVMTVTTFIRRSQGTTLF